MANSWLSRHFSLANEITEDDPWWSVTLYWPSPSDDSYMTGGVDRNRTWMVVTLP